MDKEFNGYVEREANRICSEIHDPPEFTLPDWLPTARDESIDHLYTRYKREYDRVKMYASFDRTLRDIEALPETRTDFGD